MMLFTWAAKGVTEKSGIDDAKYSENPPLTYGVLPSPGGPISTAVAAATAPTFDVVVVLWEEVAGAARGCC